VDNGTIFQGRDDTLTAQLASTGGTAYTGYAGTEAITANFWAGDETAPIADVAAASWLSAAAGTVTVAIAGSATAPLVPGTYDLELVIAGRSVWRGQVNLEPAPGSTAGRTAKVTLRHLRKHYRAIDKVLGNQLMADDPTALEARADAWDWFTDLLHRHYRGSGTPWSDTSFGPWIYGAAGNPYGTAVLRRDGRRSAELQGWLDAGGLDLTTPVLDAMAFYALAQLLGGMVSGGDDKQGYASMACRFAAKAEARVQSLTAEIDTNGDSINDITITLGLADTLEG
jgi:hypothetical protein